jgi:3,4-dihydroxy 2-butanone 4-phosphate synthase/GTP cyclohydrolase II
MIAFFDDERGHGTGHLMASAERVTPDMVNFMARHALGIVSVGLSAERADDLGLNPMAGDGRNSRCEDFTVSVEARKNVSTGISTADRATTIRVLADPGSTVADLVSPGHVFPARAHRGGVVLRPRAAEACVDLARLAGQQPCGVWCAILDAEGAIATQETVQALATEHGLPYVKMSELVRHRLERESFVELASEGTVETAFGEFRLAIYRSRIDGTSHPVLVHGDPTAYESIVARIHSQCLTGDVFHSLRCDCGDQLNESLRKMAEAGCGVLVYLRQEGRGIGLVNKVRAYALQDVGSDTVEANLALGFEADERSFATAAQIFRSLGVRGLKLITNNEHKLKEMESLGIPVTERIALDIPVRAENEAYLRAKKNRLGHLLDL